MDPTALAVALTAGMIAAFNPCGFALLPAYLALFLGDQANARPGTAVAKALGVGAAVTAGFVLVFSVAGILISAFAVQVSSVTPYATVVIGLLLAALGGWMLAGHEISLRIPRLSRTAGTGVPGMFVYGIVYATVSLSCTIPVFLVAVVGAFRTDSFLSGVVVVLTYALGMGLVLTSLAVALALAKEGMVKRSRGILPYLSRISGVLLLVAGLYVAWYGYVELRVLNGDLVSSGPVDLVARWSGEISTAIDNHRTLILVAALGVVLLGVVLWLVRRSRTANSADSLEEEPEVSTAGKELL